MIRTVKPKNARSKRAQDARAPKLVEGQKTTLLLRGSSASETIQSVLGDLHALKKPAAVKFTKKNSGIHPFEDGGGGTGALEFFSRKNDASLLVLASHSKKRPHNLTLARTFDHRLLDLHEFGVDPATYAALDRFRMVEKPRVGCKPMLLFVGDGWEHDARMRTVKALWMDFFRGVPVDSVDVEGLQYVLSFTAAPVTADGDDGGSGHRMHLRGHMIRTRRSGQKLPRVEVEETGPRIDLTLRRVQEAGDEMLKEALKTPRKQLPKTKKNVSTDIIGDKVGRIHTGKQDLGKLQTRKMKGLKKRGAEDVGEDDSTLFDDGDEVDSGTAPPKKARRE